MMRLVARLVVTGFFLLPAAGAAQTSGPSGTTRKSVAPPSGLAIPKDMTPYYLVLLVPGKNSARSSPEVKAGHLAVETHAAMLPSLASLKIAY